VLRTVLAAFLSVVLCSIAVAEPTTTPTAPSPPSRQAVTAAFAEALRQAIGAPARVNLGEQATVRLSGDLMFLPPQAATKLWLVIGRPVPEPGPGTPDMLGLLMGSEGIDMSGFIRFVPTGFVDADTMPTWTPDDILASLRDSVERANADRLRQNQPALEARAWVQPPHYDPQTHQLVWAALVIPKSAPRGSDGEVIYHAVAFGRGGFIDLSIASSLEKAERAEHLIGAFLGGLNFLPGKGYKDAGPQDPRAENGLSQAMGIDALHKVQTANRFWSSDIVIPAAGGLVALIGVLSLAVYFSRHTRREARRG
jgi:uncharacterized membrane-anchored protein